MKAFGAQTRAILSSGPRRYISQFSHGGQLPVNTIIKFVPQQEAWIVERMGKYNRTLEGGLAILIPVLDKITYCQTLKEVAVGIKPQPAITADNVTIRLDGVLYYKIVDPLKASYGIENAEYAVTQLAQTAMRSEIGQMTLDKTLSERSTLNQRIVESMNNASTEWGIKCLRYISEVIQPPENVVASMHQQVSAERKKRAEILESEGVRQAAINVAQGHKQSQILESEAYKLKLINAAEGEAQSIAVKAQANAQAIKLISDIMAKSEKAPDAVRLSLAEKYIEAFHGIAKEGNSLIIPSNIADVSGMLASAMKIIQNPAETNPQSNLKLPVGQNK